jgi:hypothetical protein
MCYMNRRNFLKLFGIGSAVSTVPVATWFTYKSNVDRELDDLYDYLESHTIYHPVRGEIPFKLYPFQKQILRQIHENDRVVFVKSRQIGMTTLLTGYYRWCDATDGLYRTFRLAPRNDVLRTLNGYTPILRKVPRVEKLEINDEPYYIDRFGVGSSGKIIVAATVDPDGRLKRLIDNQHTLKFKVFTYPASECFPMWNADSICRGEKYLPSRVADRELHCKFV